MKWLVVLVGLCLLVARGWGLSVDDDEHGFDDDEPASLAQGQAFASDPFQVKLDILYCGVTGTGTQAFDQVKQFLETQFPGQLKVSGSEYALSVQAQAVLLASKAFQAAGTVFAIGGVQLVEFLGVGNHPAVHVLLQRKIQLLMASYVVTYLGQNYAKTDAFEIYINGERVFSKLERHRMPSFDELSAVLTDHGVKGLLSNNQDRYQSLHAKSI